MQTAQTFLLTINHLYINNMTQPVLIPFLSGNRINKPDGNYFQMLKNRICPNFQVASLSTLLIITITFLFIFTRVIYSPGGYSQFLQAPKQTNKYALDAELNHSNKLYYYQTVTSFFIHDSYQQFIGSLVFAFFILYELEHCWRLGIILALVAGFAANSLGLAIVEGIHQGFEGVLCASAGIAIAAMLLHCSMLRAKFGNQFYFMIMLCVMLLIMVMGMAQTATIYFFGFVFGITFGLALYPRSPDANINENIDKVLKIVGIVFLGLAVLIGLLI